MRYRVVENVPQGHNKKQVWIAVNVNELDLLAGMAQSLSLSLPKNGPTARLRSVMKQMNKEMRKCIAELEEAGIDKRSKEKYPYDNRSVI